MINILVYPVTNTSFEPLMNLTFDLLSYCTVQYVLTAVKGNLGNYFTISPKNGEKSKI